MPARHIIIADDDAGVRAVLTYVVGRTYPSVIVTDVADGGDALAAYQQLGADLVITNAQMPVLHGLDLIRALRALSSTVPILMVSAEPHNEALALAAGAHAFLLKPFTLSMLHEALLALLPP